jgi:enolase-phosphatase E1
MLRDEHATDSERGLEPPPLARSSRNGEVGSSQDEIASMAAYVCWLIECDRKSAGLKSLQGKIWERGYVEGTLKAPLFADVAPALRRWRGAGLKVGIFSSGSVLAQKLLFAHTEDGDLMRLIDRYFDTSSGAKTDAGSYRRIASAFGLRARDILFISDVAAELDAADEAGMPALMCVRPGNPPQPKREGRRVVSCFDDIQYLSLDDVHGPRIKDS